MADSRESETQAAVIRAVRLQDTTAGAEAGGLVFAELMVRVWACWQHRMLDSHWWNKLGNAPMHTAVFPAISVNEAGAQMCEDIHSPKLLICQPPAKADTVQHEARWLSWSEVGGQAALCHAKRIYPWLWLPFFKLSLAVQHANNRNQFKPRLLHSAPRPPLSRLWWRASQLWGWVRWGQLCCVCLCGE